MNSEALGVPSPLVFGEESGPKERPLFSLVFAALAFFVAYKIMPPLWLDLSQWATTSGIPPLVFDIIGFFGVTSIVVVVIALKCDLFGTNNPDKNLLFLWVSTIGALLHLLSFVFYFNPYGIALDTVFVLVGLVGIVNRRSMSAEEKRLVSSKNAPSFTRYFMATLLGLVFWLAMARTVWPFAMKLFAPWPDQPFLICGWVAGIFILSSFLGQAMGWLSHTGKWYTPLYLVGVVGYLFNLLLEFNPWTVALEITLFMFFFKSVRNWVFFNPMFKK